MCVYNILAVALLFGLASCSPQAQIIKGTDNGTDTDITKYPFMASLRSTFGDIYCGCTIIAPRWVLTNADCISGRFPDRIIVQYGVTNISEDGPNIVAAKKLYVHEHYLNYYTYSNDIGLVELSEPIVFNGKTVAPVTLPKQNYEIPQTQEGAPGVLLAWSQDPKTLDVYETLQEIALKIYSDKECDSRHDGILLKEHICGGADEGANGLCDGDFGGPLLETHPNGPVQVGIASWSVRRCKKDKYPGVFTKVSHYIDWIEETMNSAE